MKRALALVVAAVAGALAVRACAGPRPSVAATWLEQRSDGWIAAARIRNAGGDGEIQVTFRLRDRVTGRTIPAEGTAQVRRGEEVEVRAAVPAPPGDWSVEAESEYPPQ
ncbi:MULTISPECIES: hypothetical protein [Anaeromyxobacter]|uniref:hypothetical protein n=1 Tax=Anaeromyxobacter TaxID=161492 RepID=UPI001F57C73F|nr:MULTISPECIES: hypothetical protein [unclassified Anaeromyxobacter]